MRETRAAVLIPSPQPPVRAAEHGTHHAHAHKDGKALGSSPSDGGEAGGTAALGDGGQFLLESHRHVPSTLLAGISLRWDSCPHETRTRTLTAALFTAKHENNPCVLQQMNDEQTGARPCDGRAGWSSMKPVPRVAAGCRWAT